MWDVYSVYSSHSTHLVLGRQLVARQYFIIFLVHDILDHFLLCHPPSHIMYTTRFPEIPPNFSVVMDEQQSKESAAWFNQFAFQRINVAAGSHP